MYHVRFIKNWNGSALIPDNWNVDPLLYNGIEAADLLPGNQQTIRDTNISSLGKIEWLDRELTTFDPEQFIGDDFFMSQPREAKLRFLRDSDGWLESKFKENDELEEINCSLYYEEDGSIIDYETINYGIDPQINIGSELGDDIVYEKEALIQQFSKYIVQIYNKLSGEDNVILYTGFIDKSKTDMNSSTITLYCTDIVGVIEKFAEQLIRVVPGDEDQYSYVVSQNIVEDFIQKIIDFTKLNLEYNNELSLYTVDDSDIIPINQHTFTETEHLAHDHIQVGSVEYYIYDVWDRFTLRASANGYFVIFGVYLAISLSGNTYNDVVELYAYKTYGVINDTVSGYQFFAKNLGDYDNLLNSLNTIYSDGYNIGDFSDFLHLNGTAYIDINDNVVIAEEYELMSFNFYSVYQDYYTLAIPFYSGSYNYIDLFKTILYLNVLCIYSGGEGSINIIDKSDFENSDLFDIHSNEILKNGYGEKGVERNTYVLSDALDNVWYDSDNDGQNITELNAYMRSIYSDIFINKYPLEMKCKILRKDKFTNENKIFYIGTRFIALGNLWTIIRVKLNSTGYYYDVSSYKIAGFANATTMYAFQSITGEVEGVDVWNVNNVNDSNNNTYWMGNVVINEVHCYIAWVSVPGKLKMINKYKVKASHNVFGTDYDPKSWNFKGKDMYGNWSTLDTQTDISFTEYQERIYTLSTVAACSEYRLEITDSWGPGSAVVQINEASIYYE